MRCVTQDTIKNKRLRLLTFLITALKVVSVVSGWRDTCLGWQLYNEEHKNREISSLMRSEAKARTLLEPGYTLPDLVPVHWRLMTGWSPKLPEMFPANQPCIIIINLLVIQSHLWASIQTLVLVQSHELV